MPGSKVESGFSLIGLMDGTTLSGYIRVEGYPLNQRYTPSTGAFVPDFEAVGYPEDKLPTAILIITNTSNGSVEIPQISTLVWKYNGIELKFGADGLCTTSGLVGVFKRIDTRPTVVGGQTYNLPALQVRKNLATEVISGLDNDRLSVSGTVEMDGNSISFAEISKEVIIQESTGNAYAINIEGDRTITEDNTSVTQTCVIYKNENVLSDYTGITFKWEKIISTGNVTMGTSRTQVVTNNDVDSVLILRCTATIGEESQSLSAVVAITDASDPYEVQFNITGITGNCIRKNETALITPKVIRRSDSSEVVSVSSWTWYIRDNKGNNFTLAGKDSHTFEAASASITYADIRRADMGISGSVSTTV